MKKLVMILLLCGMMFAGTEIYETEPNDGWEDADVFIFGDALVGGFDDTETTWHDSWVVTLDHFGVITMSIHTDEGLSVAPGLWDVNEFHKMLSTDWSEYGGSESDTEYLFPGTYYLNVAGMEDYGVEPGTRLEYRIETVFQGSPAVTEVEPNNDHESANDYLVGDEITGVWNEGEETSITIGRDYFEVYLEPGVYMISAEYAETVCFGAELQYPEGSERSRVLEVEDDTPPRMWVLREGDGSKSAQYEVTEAGTYYIRAETENCAFKTAAGDAYNYEDEYDYMLIPYTFTLTRVGDLGETPPAVDDGIPEPTLYDEEVPEPTLYDDGAPPAPPECESDSDCLSGACINGYCYVEPECPYECCTDLDCERITDICVNNECVDVFSDIDCGDKTCGEDEFLNSVCECTPLGGGVIDPCCGTAFVLLAVFGFVIRKG